MLEVVTATALVLVASVLCGSALWGLAGLDPRSPAGPAVGFAAIVSVAGIAIRLPGRAATSAVVILGAFVLSVAYLRTSRWRVGLPVWAATAAVVTVVLAMIPFGVIGHVGLLGVGANDDTSQHLLAAWTLKGPVALGSNKLVSSGYPIGPHALVATIARATGMSLEHAFTGLILAVPALLALAAGGLLNAGPRALRAALAVAVGLCYLQAAYLVQASFKEPMETVILFGFVGCVYVIERERPRGRALGLPLAVLAAGAVYINSYPGLLWPAAAFAVWVGARVAFSGWRRVWVAARAMAVPGALTAAAFLVIIAPEISRMITFAQSGYNKEAPDVLGNLLRSLPPQEALGIWPRMDFRFDVPVGSFAGVLALVALVAVVACLVRSVIRRDLVLPSAFIAVAALYGISTARSPYTAAKALVVLAPFVPLLLGREMLMTFGRSGLWRVPWGAVLAGFIAAGAYSDLQVLRDGPVGPTAHASELASLRPSLGSSPTLFMGTDDFVHWELRGANIATPPAPLYRTNVVPLRRSKVWPHPAGVHLGPGPTTTDRLSAVGLAFDFDSVPAPVLDRFVFAVVPRTAYASAVPPNWHLVRTTGSYGLWHRTAPTLPRQTLTEVDNPGATLDCGSSAGRRIAGLAGVAAVRPAPVIGERQSWKGAVGYAGRSARQTLRLGAGTWDISLQYDSEVSMTVHGPGLRASLPASLEPLGPYWFVGRLRVTRPGRIRITLTSSRLTALARVLGSKGLTRGPAPTGLRALGRVVATRTPLVERTIPLASACGRYVDWYRTF